jgi:hypothetical protein
LKSHQQVLKDRLRGLVALSLPTQTLRFGCRDFNRLIYLEIMFYLDFLLKLGIIAQDDGGIFHPSAFIPHPWFASETRDA